MEFNNQNEDRELITAEAFLELIKEEPNQSNTININGKTVDEDIYINSENLAKTTININFHNCKFSHFSIVKVDDQIQLNFTGCEVLNLGASQDLKRIENHASIILKITGNSDIKRIFFSERASISLYLDDSTIGEIKYRKSIFTDFECNNINFKDKLVIEDSKFDSVLFKACNFENYVTFYESTITDTLGINQCDFKREFQFSIKEKTADLSNLKIKIQSCKTDACIVLSGKSSNIDRLFLYNHRGDFSLSDLNINSCEICGFNQRNASYRFYNTCFNIFKSTGINSRLILSFIKSLGNKSMFSIGVSDLRDTTFFDVNFASFDRIILYGSDLTNISTSSVIWFEDDKLQISLEPENSSSLLKREFYRQLKYNQEKQGNKIQALKFLRLEMEYYSQELTPKNNSIQNLLKNKISGFFGHFFLAFTSQNRFILWVGKSNDHGQNFLKPIIILIALSFPFYLLILCTVYTNIDFTFLQEHLNVWAQLLNPIHDVSKILNTENLCYTTHILDLVWKIVEAILIFQTITAFRKYIRV